QEALGVDCLKFPAIVIDRPKLFPLRPEPHDSLIHHPCLRGRNSTGKHGVVEDEMGLLMGARLRNTIVIVDDRCDPMLTGEGSSNDAPKKLRDGCAVDDSSRRHGPLKALFICKRKFFDDLHQPAVVQEPPCLERSMKAIEN